jgi:hypothetical protein
MNCSNRHFSNATAGTQPPQVHQLPHHPCFLKLLHLHNHVERLNILLLQLCLQQPFQLWQRLLLWDTFAPLRWVDLSILILDFLNC